MSDAWVDLDVSYPDPYRRGDPDVAECCGVTGFSYRDPMHTHRCTIVLVDDPEVDDHDSHACYCGDWWHER